MDGNSLLQQSSNFSHLRTPNAFRMEELAPFGIVGTVGSPVLRDVHKAVDTMNACAGSGQTELAGNVFPPHGNVQETFFPL